MIRALIAFLLLASLNIYGLNQTVDADHYAQRIYNAFLLQSIGEPKAALDCFKQALQDAKKDQEDPKKLILLNELFIWYRMYGSSLGFTVAAGPSSDYLLRWAAAPQGGRYIQAFLFGIGELEALLFDIYLTTPMGLASGSLAAQDCFCRCLDPLPNDRRSDLLLFQTKAKNCVK